MYETITNALRFYNEGNDKHMVFNHLLENILKLTESEYGFIGEVLYKDGLPYLRTRAITNIAWTEELKKQHNDNKKTAMNFMSLDTLFGLAITEKTIIISNDPVNDQRRGGKSKLPHGHPPLDKFAGIPFTWGGELTGMIGIANRKEGYTEEYIKSFSLLFEVCSSMLYSYRLQEEHDIAIERSNNFLSQISHDIRTPLNGIYGYCQLLAMNRELDETNKKYIKSISDCAEIILELIDDILSISKSVIETKIEILSITEELSDIMCSLKHLTDRNNIYIIDDTKSSDIILGDKKIVKIILLNLISNAVKYNKNRGTVQIKTETVDDSVFMTIKDTGVGISKDDLKDIFDPFFRCENTKHIQGNGLGLPIAEKYIKILGGGIDISSELDIGTKITIKFKKGKAPENNSVLYVEDDLMNQELMKSIAEQSNIPLVISPSIKDARNLIKNNSYSMYILDMNLSDGKGIDLLDCIKDIEKVVILTADASINTKKIVYDSGIKHHLYKPFNINELISVIELLRT